MARFQPDSLLATIPALTLNPEFTPKKTWTLDLTALPSSCRYRAPNQPCKPRPLHVTDARCLRGRLGRKFHDGRQAGAQKGPDQWDRVSAKEQDTWGPGVRGGAYGDEGNPLAGGAGDERGDPPDGPLRQRRPVAPGPPPSRRAGGEADTTAQMDGSAWDSDFARK